jgi:hypothetical protein
MEREEVSGGDLIDSDLTDDDAGEGAYELADEASYTCGSCGEEIVVPLDASAGEHQSYVEDCPVCCSPNEITVEFDEDGRVSVSSRPE